MLIILNTDYFTWVAAVLALSKVVFCNFVLSFHNGCSRCSVNWETQTLGATTYVIFLFAMGLVVPVSVILFSYLNIIFYYEKVALGGGNGGRNGPWLLSAFAWSDLRKIMGSRNQDSLRGNRTRVLTNASPVSYHTTAPPHPHAVFVRLMRAIGPPLIRHALQGSAPIVNIQHCGSSIPRGRVEQENYVTMRATVNLQVPDFRMWESCRTIPLVGGSPVSPALALRRCSILTSFHPHRLSRPQISQADNYPCVRRRRTWLDIADYWLFTVRVIDTVWRRPGDSLQTSPQCFVQSAQKDATSWELAGCSRWRLALQADCHLITMGDELINPRETRPPAALSLENYAISAIQI
ncbi:hypothetical protein PR048_003457 [Dryococelus australis]|uniref:Uncharacterized protein n=1 Tax=Dryococelus australis TaxID=614101 RepID=A0ABQ9IN67_9NEOP|nr:hypothetical protein PR048_003457 [Dryococelus australis]